MGLLGDFGLEFQVADKIAEGDLIRLIVLTVELIISLCLTAISLSKSVYLAGSGSVNVSNQVTPNETLSQATASVVLFSIVGVVYIVAIVVGFVWLWCKESSVKELSKKNLARGISTAIGGLFYYIGDNLPPLVEEYAEELSCSPDCVERTQITGIVMLVCATTTYLPIAINAVFTHNKDENDKVDIPSPIAVFLLMAKITDLDLVYTSIERIIPRTCDETIVGGTWAYYIIYIFVFTVVTVYAVWCICKDSTFAEKFCVVFNALLICVFMACYILADNRLPLGCTGSLMDNRLAQDGLKFALLVITSIISIYSTFVFSVWCIKNFQQSCH